MREVDRIHTLRVERKRGTIFVKDEILAIADSHSVSTKFCEIMAEVDKSLMRRSICEEESSRSFSNICATSVTVISCCFRGKSYYERLSALFLTLDTGT